MDRSQLLAVFLAGSLVGGLSVRSLSDAGPLAATANDGDAGVPSSIVVTAYTVRPGSVTPLFPLPDGGFAVAMETCAHVTDDGGTFGASLGCRVLPVTSAGDLAAAETLNQLAASAFAVDGGELDAGAP